MKKLLKTTCARFAAATAVVVSLAVSGVAMADPHTEALEKRLQIMEEQMRMMQDEVARVRQEAQQPSEKVLELEEWVAKVNKLGPMRKKNMIFFRGGFARNDTDRTGDILTDANTDLSGGAATNIAGSGLNTNDFTGNSPNGDNDGWYFGAGIEHNLSEDFFGLWDDTEVFGEIMFQYIEFDSEDVRRAPLATAANDSVSAESKGVGTNTTPGPVCSGSAAVSGGLTASGAGPYGSCTNDITVTQFTLTASPKIKFMKGSKFRPWIIPAGFTFNVVSPPSDGVTYIAPGVMFAAGAEYNLWDNIYVGVDGRYNLTSNATDGVDIDGFTAGGYLGVGF